MKKIIAFGLVSASLALLPLEGFAQYKKKKDGKETPKTEVQLILEEADSAETPVVISLEQALKIALSENIAVKVADKEIERTKYAKKGTYASLFPQIDATGSYQRTIKKQVMYMDFDMSSFGEARRLAPVPRGPAQLARVKAVEQAQAAPLHHPKTTEDLRSVVGTRGAPACRLQCRS